MKPLLLLLTSALLCAAKTPLNVIVIFTDDQGYADLGCFGSKTIKTPHIDQLAKEGRRFTSFYVASPVCSPSRAALLTGNYPKRINMHRHVLFPKSTFGLNPEEYTLADHFSSHGYATACVGKWHLGHKPEVLPRAHGFDSYFGIPYSNDMNHPDNSKRPKGGSEGMDVLWNDPESAITAWNTPLVENETITEVPVDQRTITRRYTDRAITFVNDCAEKEKPFFLYLPHSMPHIPLYVPDEVRDADPKNAYINVIEHIDDQVGRLVSTLRELEIADNTLIVYTSDNGPWLTFKHHGGSAEPLREGKGTNYEGGQRVPCVMWAPGHISPDTTCDQMMSTLDLLPTLASITRTELPEGHNCDGYDASRIVLGDEASPRNEFVYYTSNGTLAGIRIGPWKLLELTRKKKLVQQLFNLENDLSETINLAPKHPEIVARLQKRMKEIDDEITLNARPVWGVYNHK
ncbi:sulfatase family protein [Roseibacillus persicicus]|uniref:Arylsulfatase n=1 Tax=Roseibacillus persicicus TaxID=454148 RepID=A0A918TGR2_9BACT|nr:sulfatase [Roseibacillus persicicus]GHC48548.1 arylsulfatase [Roseibacillus persicicus]